MRYLTEIVINATEVTIPMLAELDTALRENGSPTEPPAEWYVEGECRLLIPYVFESEDLWQARTDLDDLDRRLTDVGLSEGGVTIRKPTIHPEVKTQLLMTGLSEKQATAIGHAVTVIEGIIPSHVQFEIAGTKQNLLVAALRSIVDERSGA